MTEAVYTATAEYIVEMEQRPVKHHVIILEEAIPGFEVGCAVLGNEALLVGEPDEIELSNGFFNFKEKYTLETSTIHVPARVTAALMTDNKQHDTRTTRRPDCVTEIRMGNSVLVVSGYFKKDTTTTAADKMARVLEAEADATQKPAI